MRIAPVREAILALLLTVTGAAAEVKLESVFTHTGMCEASGAVALPAGSFGEMFVVANDEDNVLRAYAADRSGAPRPMPTGDLNKHLGLEADSDDKADFEAATWLGGRIYWIGSHSRSGKGNLKEARWQFFASTIAPDREDLLVTATPSSHKLIAAFAALDPALAEAIRLDRPKDPALAPKEMGFNIEGMTAHADGTSMLIGLRSPLSADGKALLVPLANPQGVAENGEDPILGPVIKLDLGGRGVRDIAYSAGANAYFIIAGPVGIEPDFELYRWSGEPSEAAKPVDGFKAAFTGTPQFQPEALIVDPSGRRLHILSDDGQHRHNGVKCEDRTGAERFFRSFVVTIE